MALNWPGPLIFQLEAVAITTKCDYDIGSVWELVTDGFLQNSISQPVVCQVAAF